MNPDTGRFEELKPDTPVDWNRYGVGDLVQIGSDAFRIDQIRNAQGRGVIVMTALNRDERVAALDRLRDSIRAENLSRPKNRGERRRAAREIRREAKRKGARKRG